jgi:hypothetical protein
VEVVPPRLLLLLLAGWACQTAASSWYHLLLPTLLLLPLLLILLRFWWEALSWCRVRVPGAPPDSHTPSRARTHQLPCALLKLHTVPHRPVQAFKGADERPKHLRGLLLLLLRWLLLQVAC